MKPPSVRSFFLVAALLIACATTTFSQPATGAANGQFDPTKLPKIGKLTGIVMNKSTNTPVEYATVAVFRGREEKPTSGAIANKQGQFTVDKLAPGRYRVKITFMSFTTKWLDSVVITMREPHKDFGAIELEPNAMVMKDVNVTAEKEAVQIAVDRKIYNVEKDLSTSGGTAVDVLQNVPSVTVDADRTISLRGSSNVTLFIDGRPSTLTLEQLPADNIERIEVITNPSAKFDPDGTSGIINIVLKKNQQAGYNGTVTLNAGTRDKYNASANVNYRDESVNVFLNYGYQANRFFGLGNSWQENTVNPASPFYVRQLNDGVNKAQNHGIRGGADYYLNEWNTISFSASYNPRARSNRNSINYEFLNAAQTPTSSQQRSNVDADNGWNGDVNLSYRRTFADPKQLFTADVRYSHGANVNSLEAAQTYSDGTPANFQETRNPVATSVLRVQTDYEHPLSPTMKLEAGALTQIRRIDNDFYSQSARGQPSEYKPDVNLSNHFIYDEQVYGLYAVVSGGIDNTPLTYSAGGRLEQTFFVSNQLTTNQRLARSYFNFFPTAALKLRLPDEHEFGVNFSRRINRPSADALNPFPEYSDPFNFRVGNPALNPEYISSVELSYLKYFGNLTLNPSVYYRFTDDVISRFREVNADGVSVTSVRNFSQSNTVGAELIAQYEPFKWWKLNVTANYFWNRINADNVQAGLSNASFGGNARVMSNMRVWEDIDVQVSYSYFLPTVLAQGTFKAIQAWDAAVKKDFFDNKLSVTLRVSDIFDTRQFGIITEGNGFKQDFTRKRESQIVFLGISYRFSGGIEFEERQRARKRERGENSEGGGESEF